jgi:hypothetical protein
MAKKKKEATQTHLDEMIAVLKLSIAALQAMIEESVKNKSISIAELSRATKMIGETLNQIYRIEFGKAQKEEMLQKIGELQRHFDRAQQLSAARERAARTEPNLLQTGRILSKEEIEKENEEQEEATDYHLSLEDLKNGI